MGARLVQHVQNLNSYATPEVVIDTLIEFAQTQGRWLKIASGDKSACLEAAVSSSMALPRGTELLVECGAFVGFSAIRIAQQGIGRSRVLSFEIDPVHVVVARFITELALPPAAITFCVGRASDSLPIVVEDSGEQVLVFLFLDHSNAHFHTDFHIVELVDAVGPGANVLADNVLKPGAPIFVWQVVKGPTNAVAWAMSEFRQEDQEDWMAAVNVAPLPLVLGA